MFDVHFFQQFCNQGVKVAMCELRDCEGPSCPVSIVHTNTKQ